MTTRCVRSRTCPPPVAAVVRAVAGHPVDVQGLHGAGRGGPQDPLALLLGRVGVVHEGLGAVHREDLRREERALRVPLASGEIDDDPHETPQSALYPTPTRIEGY